MTAAQFSARYTEAMSTPTIPQRILVPIDYGLPSKKALEKAVVLARTFKAELLVLFAWAAPFADLPLSSDHKTEEHESLFDLVRKQCEDTMIGFIREVETESPDVRMTWTIVSGDPRRVIVEHAIEQKADLIIMGSHGPKGPERWLLGSVAEGVLRHAPCPVMIIPSKDD